jgi:hypothetical protein
MKLMAISLIPNEQKIKVVIITSKIKTELNRNKKWLNLNEKE